MSRDEDKRVVTGVRGEGSREPVFHRRAGVPADCDETWGWTAPAQRGERP